MGQQNSKGIRSDISPVREFQHKIDAIPRVLQKFDGTIQVYESARVKTRTLERDLALIIRECYTMLVKVSGRPLHLAFRRADVSVINQSQVIVNVNLAKEHADWVRHNAQKELSRLDSKHHDDQCALAGTSALFVGIPAIVLVSKFHADVKAADHAHEYFIKEVIQRVQDRLGQLECCTRELSERQGALQRFINGLKDELARLRQFLNQNPDVAPPGGSLRDRLVQLETNVNKANALLLQNPEVKWEDDGDKMYKHAVGSHDWEFITGFIKAGRVEPGTANKYIGVKVNGDNLLVRCIRYGRKELVRRILDAFQGDVLDVTVPSRHGELPWNIIKRMFADDQDFIREMYQDPRFQSRQAGATTEDGERYGADQANGRRGRRDSDSGDDEPSPRRARV